jgi:hypothetical protein
MNKQDHISVSLEAIFCVKMLKFFDADPGSGIYDGKKFGSGIQDKLPGSATLHFHLNLYNNSLAKTEILEFS